MSISNIFAIAACDPNGVLGKAGRLPWHYPEDLQHFSNTTRGHILVIGFRTFLTLPKSYFKQRQGIVFSRQHPIIEENNVISVNSLEAFLKLKCLSEDKDIYVIGGAQIYTLFLEAKLIRKVILTMLKRSYEGDVFFPLSLIHSWPRQKIQENDDFTIYHYIYPMKLP